MDTQKLDAAISEAIAALLAISTALKQAEQPAAPLKVGDWVNETVWGDGQILDRPRDTDGGLIPPEALAGRDNWTVKFVSGRHGNRDPRGLICEADTLTRIDPPAPAQPAPLKYKPGDIVLVPCRVEEIIDGRQPYHMVPLGDTGTTDFFLTRAALEPEPPQVGDTCVFWNGATFRGKVEKIDKSKLPYRRTGGDWFYNAVKVSP